MTLRSKQYNNYFPSHVKLGGGWGSCGGLNVGGLNVEKKTKANQIKSKAKVNQLSFCFEDGRAFVLEVTDFIPSSIYRHPTIPI